MRSSCFLTLFSIILLFTNAQSQSDMSINKSAPVVQSKSIFIKANPKKVWQVLTDIEKWDEWNQRITKPRLDQKLDVNTSFSWKIKGTKIKSTIEVFKTEEILAWSGKTFGAKALHYWFLEPTQNGTKVSVEESMEGWLISLMKKKMNGNLADDMEHWLQQLKKKCEK